MQQIFISYAREDIVWVNDHLQRDLQDLEANIWVDRDGIRAGEKWMEKIDEALSACDIMLLVISPKAMKSEAVRKEYEHFLEHKKILIPVLHRLAEVPVSIRELQYVDFRALNYPAAFARLHAELKRHGVPLKDIPPGFSHAQMPGQRLLPLNIGDMINITQRNLWICGVGLDSVARAHLDKLRTKQREGVEFRIMTIALQTNVLNETALYLGAHHSGQAIIQQGAEHIAWFERHGLCDSLLPAARQLGIRVRRSLTRLSELAAEFPEQFKIRLLRQRPLFGYIIVDPDDQEKAQLAATPYFFLLEQKSNGPAGPNREHAVLHLTGKSHDEIESEWFKRYKDDFDSLWWNGADELDIQYLLS